VILPDDWQGDQSLLYDKSASYVYRVPRKWRMLATLNTDDKASLFEMSYAFLRRFAFIHIPLPTARGLEAIGASVLRDRVKLDAARTRSLLSLWESIVAVRPLGPALLIDMARYLHSRRADDDGRWSAGVAEAVAQFVVPQLEGLTPEQLLRFRTAVSEQDAAYWTAELQEACVAFVPAMLEAPADGLPKGDDAANEGDDVYE
jgi:MoxR-like ATPase